MKLPAALLLISLVSALPVAAQAEEELPWYQVEMVVFSQQDLYHSEKHSMDLHLSYPQNWQLLSGSPLGQGQSALPPATDSVDPATAPDRPVIATERPYIALDKQYFKLDGDAFALKRAPGYQVLLHQAWRQQGLDVKQSPWIIVAGGEAYGDRHELEGSVRLVLNRYLHFQANLWRSRFGAPVSTSPTEVATITENTLPRQNSVAAAPSWPPLPELPWRQQVPATTGSPDWSFQTPQFAISDLVTLNQSTRINLGELTYLDHPSLGVLVWVSRYQPKAAE
ncbi:CsiV family protein [Porticoccus sp.]